MPETIANNLRGISLGTWIIIAGIVVGIAMQWQDFRTNAAAQRELTAEVRAMGAGFDKLFRAVDLRLVTAENRLSRHEERFSDVGDRTRQIDDRITEWQKTLDARYNSQAELITARERVDSERERKTAQQYSDILVRLAQIECRLNPDCRPPQARP